MSTTAFITHCWRKARRSALGLLLLASLLACWGWNASTAQAQVPGERAVQVMEASLHEREPAVLLDASMLLDLPQPVEEALHKGIPIIFVAQARIIRPRWYWSDAVLADVRRYYRLSYQPLTERWRLGVSAERPQPGGGLMFGQNFDSLDEALDVMRRIVDWRVGAGADFSVGDVYDVEFGFQLDVSQLPRPLQIGMSGQEDWRMGALVGFRWTPEARAAVPLPAAPAEAGRRQEGER